MSGLLIVTLGSSYGQGNVREKAYVHLSNKELIVGETLFFTGFVYSASTGRLSPLSSILYVDILDEKNNSIFRTQIGLENGVGAGSYYLPTELETGTYQVVAYTRWMQNFKEFYNQSITLINPYKSYINPENKSSDLVVNFYPEGGYLLDNVPNRMVIRAINKYGIGQLVVGRVIDSEGNTLTKVETDRLGCYDFTLTPKSNENYKLITSSATGFNFYDLPSTCNDCTRLNVREKGGHYLVDLKSDNTSSEPYELRISRNHEMIKKLIVSSNVQTELNKNDLPQGLIALEIYRYDKKYNERILWNGKSITEDSRSINDHFTTLKNVSTTLTIEKPSFLSISISKVSSNSGFSNHIVFDRASEQLNTPLPYFGDTLPQEHALDNILISSSLKPLDSLTDKINLLPEYLYGIIQGTLVDAKEEKPIANEVVGVSFMGSDDYVSVAKTDLAGRFALMYDYKIAHQLGSLKAINIPKSTYHISVYDSFYKKYPEFKSPPLVLDSGRIAHIVQRSIHNQIQNAYYIIDSVQNRTRDSTLLSEVHSYVLDDYTRFQTIRDTFIELIPEVGVSKNEANYELKLRLVGVSTGFRNPGPTLMLLDGVFVSSEEILTLSPFEVERIDVINKRYYLGGVFFDGIIAIYTFKKDLAQKEVSDLLINPLITQTDSSTKTVLINPSDRIPHYEELLLWDPIVKHPGGELTIDFTTSSVTGLFELSVEGISENGEPISQKKYFRVVKD